MGKPDIGAIFDWDGVIIDSSEVHREAWERLAREAGRPLPADHFKRGFGRKNQVIIPEILGWKCDAAEIERLGRRKETLYREVLAETSVRALPGIPDLLAGLREAGVPCAVGSSTELLNIQTALKVTGLAEFFTALVTADDVTHGKPHPEVFLTAAAKINRAPARCVVFEDAFVGLEAARNGGFKSIGVGTTNPVESLREKCDLAVHRLDEVSAMTIISLVRK